MTSHLARLCRKERRPERCDDGFTLIETLIALTVATILSIGIVRFFATTSEVARGADRRFTVATLLMQLADGLPRADALSEFEKSGRRGDLSWRVSSAPIERRITGGTAAIGQMEGNGEQAEGWRPYRIVIEVEADGRIVDRAETVRLGRSASAAAATGLQ